MRKRRLKMGMVTILLLFLMVLSASAVQAATVKLGKATYTTKYEYRGNKTTIYRQQKGSAKKKLKVVNGYAEPKYEYKNVLYFEMDRVNDPTAIDVWSLNLSKKSTKRLCSNSAFVQGYKQYMIVTPNTGALTARKYSVYDISKKKMKTISNRALGANFSKGKVYFFETKEKMTANGIYSGNVYRCNISGSGKTKITKETIKSGNVIKLTSSYMEYYKHPGIYRYTYSTRKHTKIS